MRFFSSSALLVLGLAATPAYARIRAGRRLQDPAPAAPAAPAEAAAAPAAVAPVQKELPACKENFPPAKYEKSGADPFSFEAHKEAPFYKRTLAELAPCLLVEGDCGGSVWKVDVLTGALATLTQQVFDTTKAAEAAAAAAPAHADAAAPAPADAAAPAPAAPAADGQKEDAAPAVPAGETPATPAAPVEAHPEGHNATAAAHPEGHNATTEAKPADHPATEHPTGEHPAAEHNATAHAAGEHPATEHVAAPATEHPAAEHPAAAHPEGHNATTAAHPEGHNATAAATPAVVGGVDLTKFTEALSTSELMKTVLNEHAPCVAQQPGGVDGFIKDYAKAVHGFVSA